MEFSPQGRLLPVSERTYEGGLAQRNYFQLREIKTPLDVARERNQTLFDEHTYLELQASLSKIEHRFGPNILSGAHIPFVLPKLTTTYGEEFEETLFPALQASFGRYFPGKEVRNQARIPVSSASELDPASNWSSLVERRLEGQVIGWYCPEALAGYAIPDLPTACDRLGQGCFISGLSEITQSMALFPELLHPANGHYGRLLVISGLRPIDPKNQHLFWFFEAYGFDLDFNCRSMVGAVSEYYSGGVTFIA